MEELKDDHPHVFYENKWLFFTVNYNVQHAKQDNGSWVSSRRNKEIESMPYNLTQEFLIWKTTILFLSWI